MSTPIPPLVAQLLAHARSQIGEHETPTGSNRTKFSPWPRPWCADFVSYCFRAIGQPLPVIDQPGRDGFAGCPAGLEHFRKLGWVVTDGFLPGDIIFFQFDGDKQPDHVGIVTGYLPDERKVETIEGNTGPHSDAVMPRVRPETLVMAVVRVPGLYPESRSVPGTEPCWERNPPQCNVLTKNAKPV